MTINIGLPRPIQIPRIKKTEDYGGGGWGHRIDVRTSAELDDQILEWLRESYEMMGLGKRLEEKAGSPRGR